MAMETSSSTPFIPEGHFQCHCSRGSLWERLKGELRVLKKVWYALAFYFIFMTYGAAILFRNIAFYRYRGLDYYADKVVPKTSSLSVLEAGALLINTKSGELKPLRDALTADYQQPQWNVSITNLALLSNLTALNGEQFNLKDWGHEVLWDFSHSDTIRQGNEVVGSVFTILTYTFCCLSFFISFWGKARPYVAAMWLRLFRALFSVHVMRVPAYLSTVIPGTADHCQSVRWTGADGTHGEYEINQQYVQTVKDWFFSSYNLNHNSNCGDLTFSGHTVTAMTNVLIVHYYAGQMFPFKLMIFTRILGWFLFCCQVFTVITSHNHYSLDVVIAVYLAPLSFLANLHFFPNDPTPDRTQDGDATECLTRGTDFA